MSWESEAADRLRELYPALEIKILERNETGKLLVFDRTVLKFNYDLISKQINYSPDRKMALSDIVKYFAEYIEIRYIQRQNMFVKGKRGRRAANLTQSQIEYAMANTKSNKAAAEFLDVNIATYKKYAKIYDLYDKHLNRGGVGISKRHLGYKVPIEDILAGKHPNYKSTTLKYRLIRDMRKEEKCDICHYKERRIIDQKIPLILDFIDGNEKNFALENLRFICYNCAFLTRGNIFYNQIRAFAGKGRRKSIKYVETKQTLDTAQANDESDKIFERFNN